MNRIRTNHVIAVVLTIILAVVVIATVANPADATREKAWVCHANQGNGYVLKHVPLNSAHFDENGQPHSHGGHGTDVWPTNGYCPGDEPEPTPEPTPDPEPSDDPEPTPSPTPDPEPSCPPAHDGKSGRPVAGCDVPVPPYDPPTKTPEQASSQSVTNWCVAHELRRFERVVNGQLDKVWFKTDTRCVGDDVPDLNETGF